MKPSATIEGSHARGAHAQRVLWLCACMLLLASLLGGCDRWPFKGEATLVMTDKRATQIFKRGPAGCETACAVASASRHELSLLFGVDELPPDLIWGRPYVDGPGFKAFRECLGDDEPKGKILDQCFESAHKICVISCLREESKILEQKRDRHRTRDQARRKTRDKAASP